MVATDVLYTSTSEPTPLTTPCGESCACLTGKCTVSTCSDYCPIRKLDGSPNGPPKLKSDATATSTDVPVPAG